MRCGPVLALLSLVVGCQDDDSGERERALQLRVHELEARNADLEARNAALDALVHQEVTIPIAPGEPSDSTPTVPLNVMIDREGTLFLDGEPSDEAGIAARARELGATARCVIASADDAPHARVAAVLNLVRDNGVTRFAINVRPRVDESSSDP